MTGEGGPTSDIPPSGMFVLGLARPNATVIGSALMPWQGLVAPTSRHVGMHEEGGSSSATGTRSSSWPHVLVRSLRSSLTYARSHGSVTPTGIIWSSWGWLTCRSPPSVAPSTRSWSSRPSQRSVTSTA